MEGSDGNLLQLCGHCFRGRRTIVAIYVDFLLGGEREKGVWSYGGGSRRRPSNGGRKWRWEAVRICGDGVDEAVVEW